MAALCGGHFFLTTFGDTIALPSRLPAAENVAWVFRPEDFESCVELVNESAEKPYL
jgi:hypothetical protein